MPTKQKSLVIVESPAKAKTINKYLGSGFSVKASMGHVRDLPQKKFGIDVAKGFEATYQIIPGKKQTVAELQKEAKQAAVTYLATDPDREGEAIAWHLKEALGLRDNKTFRVTFNEITARAVKKAFEHPAQINLDKVNAQQTRRFLDRLVGYKLSPLLWKKVAKRLSAGRVQSVAVRLIVEREKEIQAFKPEEYWKITATLAPAKDGAAAKKKSAQTERFEAELAQWQGEKFKVGNETDALAVVGELTPSANGPRYSVGKAEHKDRIDHPAPPFQTSTLQQQASIRLRFSAKKTMLLAQQLYEGVELGAEGSVGLITYMRTDSLRASDEAIKQCRDYVQGEFGDAYLPERPVHYSAGKQAQEAHEAIRPTDLSHTPEKVEPYLGRDQQRLYELIYKRFVASQMKPAIIALTNVEVKVERAAKAGAPAEALGIFKTQGRQLKFDGYRRVLPPSGKEDDQLLPPLEVGQALDCLELQPSQHFTQPPPRYTEATLVKTLEKEGIGRPSTYAPIISTIQDRGYVKQAERKFHATELGMVVTDLLVKFFPKVMDVKFTSHMEEELDKIEEAHLDWRGVLGEFYQPFNDELKHAEENMEKVRGAETEEKCEKCGAPMVIRWSKSGRFLGCSNYPDCKTTKPLGEEGRPAPVETEHACPNCGKPLLRREGRRGPFLACSGYPECKTTMNIGPEGQPVPSEIKTEHVCEKCGSPMVLRQSRRGPFLGCSGYPKCRNAKPVDEHGNPIEPVETGIACEKCGKPMVVKRGRRGSFLGCSGYPKCRSTMPMPDEVKEKLKDQPQPARVGGSNGQSDLRKIATGETCDDCGADMVIRRSRRGLFLGCGAYPKCKGTKPMPDRLMEVLDEVGQPVG